MTFHLTDYMVAETVPLRVARFPMSWTNTRRYALFSLRAENEAT
jgi:hypothetical protein